MRHLNMYEKSKWPRILGLTASVLNSKEKPRSVINKLKKLEAIMAARVATPTDMENAAGYASQGKSKTCGFYRVQLTLCRERWDISYSKRNFQDSDPLSCIPQHLYPLLK